MATTHCLRRAICCALWTTPTVLLTSTAFAQERTLEEVIVTGSAIRRVEAEASLPVQVLDSQAIARTGAASVVDLIQRLPTVQGATVEADAVGAATFGFSGVSVHNIGENRTLVLLNGRRMALFGGQTLTGFAAAVDLNSIPVSAIQRVEILTSGASALYGSDAVAGVVNFITKDRTVDRDVSVRYTAPRTARGSEASASPAASVTMSPMAGTSSSHSPPTSAMSWRRRTAISPTRRSSTSTTPGSAGRSSTARRETSPPTR